jgi:LysR family nitrogen assimilation transcriptional regulator
VLNVAQPALGLQMRQLEQELGVTLLQRHSRGVLPTAAGQRLLERSREILELVERTAREVGALRNDAVETVRFGLTPGLMNLAGSDLLVRARRDIPRLLLRLVEDMSFALIEELRRGELEAALVYDSPEQAGLARIPWLREELLFVSAAPTGGASHPFSPQGIAGSIRFADILGAELVQADTRDAVRQIVNQAAAERALTPKLAFEVQSVQAMKILITDGLASGVLPYGSVAAELGAGRVVGRRITDPRLFRTLYLVTTPAFAALRSGDALLAALSGTRNRIFTMLGPLAETVDAGRPNLQETTR